VFSSEVVSSPAVVTPGSVVVTGICGNLGRRVARRLHRNARVIGIDRRAFVGKPKDIEHYPVDLRRQKVETIFRQNRVSALVHLGVMHDPRVKSEDAHSWNVGGLTKLLEYASRYKVRKVILLSSANVYGPRPDNAQFLTEDAPLMAAGAFSGMRDLVELDMLVQSFFWKHPEIETVILRPAHILGTVRNAPSNYLRLNVVPTLMGFDPMLQVVHQDDVVSALELALSPGVRGIFNMAGPPPMRLSRMLKRLGRKQLPIPYRVAKFGIERLWDARMTSFPAPELDFVRYVCMVDDQGARGGLGYRPAYDIDETLRAVDDERWVPEQTHNQPSGGSWGGVL
jgi:UDP-glucose 4-epimerase